MKDFSSSQKVDLALGTPAGAGNHYSRASGWITSLLFLANALEYRVDRDILLSHEVGLSREKACEYIGSVSTSEYISTSIYI
jgi:hypothetical protein